MATLGWPPPRLGICHAGPVRNLGLAVLLVASSGCSVESTAPGRAAPADPTSTTEPRPDDIDDAPTTEAPPGSTAYVRIDDTAFDLAAQCHALDGDQVVITGLTRGAHPPRVELFVQAHTEGAYVGIIVTDDGDSTTYEPALDHPPRVERLDDVYRIDEIALRADLDLTTGEGIDAGVGTVVVECATYTEGLPVDFVSD